MASRDLIVHIVGDDSSLQRAYKRSTAETKKFEQNMTRTAQATSALRGQVVGASAAFVGTAGFLAVAKASVTAASNLSEQLSKTNQVFGSSSEAVKDWAKTTVRSMGLAEDQALETASSFGALFAPLGIAGAEAAKQSMRLTQLGADLASFYNTDVQSALDAIRSGLVGESEPLRKYGVLLSEARVTQAALNQTGKDNVKQLTQQEKVLARIALIYRDTKQAQGDFARTSDGLANQSRILRANLRKLEIELGKGLVPALLDATKALNDMADAFDRLPGSGVSLRDIFNKIPFHSVSGLDLFRRATNQGASSMLKGAPTGEDVRLRGAGALGTGLTADARRRLLAGTSGRGRASLTYQISLVNEQLAKAELTAGTKDDRAALVRLQNVIKRKIAVTKDLKLRTQLYGDLKSVQDQIEAIDDKIAADKQDAADKEKAAKEKERDAEKRRLEAHREHIRRMRQLWADQLQKIRDATAQVRSEMGGLPFQPTPGGILGVTGQSAQSFATAYANQTKTFVRFYNSLGALSRAGAPRGLVEQFRGLGVEGAGLVRNLLTHPGQLRQVIRSYQQAERAAMQIAKADIHARYVTINVAGSRVGATSSTQRRGQRAGVPSFPGAVVG